MTTGRSTALDPRDPRNFSRHERAGYQAASGGSATTSPPGASLSSGSLMQYRPIAPLQGPLPTYARHDTPFDSRDRRSPTFPLRRISAVPYPVSSSYASSSSSSSPTEFRLPTLSPAVFPSQSSASSASSASFQQQQRHYSSSSHHGRTTTIGGFRVKLEDDEDEDDDEEDSFSDGEDEVDELELEMDLHSPSSSRGGGRFPAGAGMRGSSSASGPAPPLPTSLPPPPSLSIPRQAPTPVRTTRTTSTRAHRGSESSARSTISPVESERGGRTSESPSSPDGRIFGSRAPPRPKGEGTQFWCVTCGMGFYENGKLKRHTRTHSGDNTGYNCPYCPSVLSRDDARERHVSSKHPEHFTAFMATFSKPKRRSSATAKPSTAGGSS